MMNHPTTTTTGFFPECYSIRIHFHPKIELFLRCVVVLCLLSYFFSLLLVLLLVRDCHVTSHFSIFAQFVWLSHVPFAFVSLIYFAALSFPSLQHSDVFPNLKCV